MKSDGPKRGMERIEAHVLIVEARFYEDLADELARGAIETIEAFGASWEKLAVPGALEIPGAIVHAARSQRFDGFVALGVVLRGETTHYDVVAGESARGLMDLTLQGICLGNGILTCDTVDQAWARARVGAMNKGGGAAEAALRMIAIKRAMGRGEGKTPA
jgi:6,7-dimethyl-8-ribityllumazine synthase